MPPLALLLILALGLTPSDCEKTQKAYEAFRASSFQVEREFTIEVDGKPRGKQITRLEWKGGKLEETVISTDTRNGEKMEIHGDPAVRLTPSCERITTSPGDEFEIDSGDGERVAFRTDAGKGALIP